MTHLMSNYQRLPVAFRKGEGVWLEDTAGNRYLDAISGIAVCGLGHAHPAISEAIANQARQLVHTSNLYRIPLQEELAQRLCRLSGMDNAFFCNSGAEANEAAIKLARLFGHARGFEEPAVLVAENSFHGRTLATLSATGNRKAQAGFEPLVQGFMRVPYGDSQAIASVAEMNTQAVAVLIEPIQGESGIRIPPADYLEQVRAICDANNWLMILDEVQTGMGRTGEWFGFQHSDILPDIMTLAKGLGNGVPIGACLARGHAAELFKPGSHGSTFGGGPLACAAAHAVLDTIEGVGLCQHAAKTGALLLERLKRGLANLDGIGDIRGQGMMIAIELTHECANLVAEALGKGLLINVTSGSVIRLLPPLILDEQQAEQLASRLIELVKEHLAKRRDENAA